MEFENVAIVDAHSQPPVLGHVPLILRGFDLGPCLTEWKNDAYLKSRIASEKRVTVHVCAHEQMDFLNKNFQYKTLEFSTFLDRCHTSDDLDDYFICKREKYYLRALGDNPRKDVANFLTQYPSLAADLNIPDVFPKDRLFSSVLRISSAKAKLWTHYDIMDNILIQVVGHKRVILFDPNDAQYLYMRGDKSEVLDIDYPDLTRYPQFAHAVGYEARLLPGDVLFIPALWFHHVTSESYSIAVNMFWRATSIAENCFDHKDLYGNADLLPAQRAFQQVEKAIENLKCLPEPYRSFYVFRCGEMMRKKLLDNNSHSNVQTMNE